MAGSHLNRYLEWSKADVAEAAEGRFDIAELEAIASNWETSVVDTRNTFVTGVEELER